MTTQVTLVITMSGINKQVLTMISFVQYTSEINLLAINLKNAPIPQHMWTALLNKFHVKEHQQSGLF